MPEPQQTGTAPGANVGPAPPPIAIEYWPIERLREYENNPRINDHAVEPMAAMIREFGFRVPLIVRSSGELVDGHLRLKAARQLGLTSLPVVLADDLSDTQVRALRIAVNQAAAMAEWDAPLLSQELQQLKLADFDLPILGFPDLKLVEFLSGVPGAAPGAGGESGDRELAPGEKAQLIEAWQRMAADWLAILETQHSLSTNYTKGALAVHFLRSRFYSVDIPSAATLAYTPHRVSIIGDQGEASGSLIDGVREAVTNERNIVERLWFILQGKPRLDMLLGMTLPFLKRRLPGDFPSALARSLIDEFVTAPGGRVLDPCHGWGGRALGFLLSRNAVHYSGFDVDERTGAGVGAMLQDLHKLAAGPARRWRLTLCPFEDVSLKPASFDFALTSPPYFDVERYGGDDSSWRRYASFEAWTAGFYQPMLEKVARALKPGAVFALQAGNQSYPLERTACELAPGCGLAHVETRATGMVNNRTKTEEADGEVLVLLRRSNAGSAGKLKPAPAIDPAAKHGKVL